MLFIPSGSGVQTVVDAVLRELGGNDALGLAGGLGLLQHAVHGVVDVVDLLEHVLLVVGGERLLTGVDDEVGGVEDALGAAEGHTRRGVLVAHAAGQAQHVKEGVLLAGVGPQAAAADGGAEVGVVQGDDALEGRLLVVELGDLFVSVSLDHL